MLLRIILLHKNKSITIDDVKIEFKEILEFSDSGLIYGENHYFYNMKKAYRSNNILVDITTNNRKNTKKDAKSIDELKRAIIKGKHRKKYNIVVIYDGSSEYFCSKLSRFIAVFERKLREFIYLTVLLAYENEWVSETISSELENSLKGKGVNKNKFVEKALDEFSFNDYINYLFDKKEDMKSEIAIEKSLEELSSEKLNINNVIEYLNKTKKRSLWEKLFEGYDLEFSQGDLDSIREVRNTVMHNKEISWHEFENNKKLLRKLNKNIDIGILNINKDRYSKKVNIVDVFSSLQDALSKIIGRHNEIMKPVFENLQQFSRTINELIAKSKISTELYRMKLDFGNIMKQQLSSSIPLISSQIKQQLATIEIPKFTVSSELSDTISAISKVYAPTSLSDLAKQSLISDDKIKNISQQFKIYNKTDDIFKNLKEYRDIKDSYSSSDDVIQDTDEIDLKEDLEKEK